MNTTVRSLESSLSAVRSRSTGTYVDLLHVLSTGFSSCAGRPQYRPVDSKTRLVRLNLILPDPFIFHDFSRSFVPSRSRRYPVCSFSLEEMAVVFTSRSFRLNRKVVVWMHHEVSTAQPERQRQTKSRTNCYTPYSIDRK